VIDLECQAAFVQPAEYFGGFRGKGPVQWSEVHRAWLVLDHAELREAFRDSERLSADRVSSLERLAHRRPAAFGKVVELLHGWMIFRDPPAHTRLRDPVRNVFSPRRVDDLAGLVTDVVNEVVGGMPDSGEIDVRLDFAGPLPALVIASILGVDGTERHNFQKWSRDLATIVFSAEPSSTPTDRAVSATGEFEQFFGALIEAERNDPSQTMLGHLVTNTSDEFTTMELIGACTLLLFAGHETTTSLLTNTIGVLVERPDLLDQLRDTADKRLAVEEFLRIVGPARTMFRKAAVDHERGGQRIRAGDTVALVIAAANHDESVFRDPATINLTRDPNPHLSFGWGLHHCIGAHLARLEARFALQALLDRYETITAAGPIPPLKGTVLGYARESLNVQLG
jgi:cytochrome P450